MRGVRRSQHEPAGGATRIPCGHPSVCIGIPTFNRAEDLQRALVSVLRQTCSNISVIICDNASVDGTESLCRDFATRDSRIKYCRSDFNIGAAANFDAALRQSDAEYFMWLADDDWVAPDYVDQCVEYLELNPDAVIAYGAAKYYRDDRFVCSGVHLSLTDGSSWWRVFQYYWHVRDNAMFYGLIRRKLLQELRFHAAFGGDWILMSEMVSQGKAVLVPGVSLHRSLGGMSATSTTQTRMLGSAGWLKREFPYIDLAFSAARNIMNRNDGLREFTPVSKGVLAVLVFGIICLRKGLPNWVGSRGRQLRILLTSLLSWFKKASVRR